MTDLDATSTGVDGARLSYRPGSWYGVFGEQSSLLLPPGERGRVAALWDVVEGGAGFDEVLDALLAGGLRGLDGFALWSVTDELTQVVARGPVRVVLTTADGEDVLDGASAATWAERRVRGVLATVVELDDPDHAATAGPDLGLVDGLVRVGRVDVPPLEAGAAHDLGSARPDVEAEPVPAPVMEELEDETDVVATEDVTGLEAAPEPEPEPIPEEEPEPVPLPLPTAAPLSPPPFGNLLTDPLPPAHPDEQLTEQFTPAWPTPDTDTDGAGSPAAAPLLPGIPGQQHPPAVTSRPVARLVLSNGSTVDVDRAILVGRAPEARRFGAGEQPRLVTVPSPHQEISSTHLEIRPGSGADHGSAVVTDMGSTNGTVLVQPGLAPESLQPGIAVQLIPGAIIDLGDGVTIQVTNA